MKKIITLLLAFNLGFLGFINAQPKDPATWTYEAKKKTDNTYDLVVTVTLPKPWHIYSQNTGNGGPIATSINFNSNPLIIKQGKVDKAIQLYIKLSFLDPHKSAYFAAKIQQLKGI